MKGRDSPLTGGREGTFYDSSSDESFALTQGVEDLFEKATSSRLIRAIYEQQNHAQVRVINQSCKGKQQNKIVSATQNNAVEYYSNRTSVLLDLDLTSFFQGCWGNGTLAEMKGLHMDSIHAGEHDGKASLPLLVLLGRAGGGATGGHCIEEHL